jgi:formylmethanofuran dehydrogenase subunit E-like metal-binding protein
MKTINSGFFNFYVKAKVTMLMLACIAITSLVLISCKEKKISNTGNPTKQVDTTQQTVKDEIVTFSAIDNAGVILKIAFNNTKGTAIFTFNSETIELKQDTMGSGVKYSNGKYEYTEWHGRIELKKEGKTIFITNEDEKDQTGK